MLPSLLTYDEVADHLRSSLSTVKRLVSSGRLPAVHVGGGARVHTDDLLAFMDELRGESAGPLELRAAAAVAVEHRSLSERPEFRAAGTQLMASGVAMRYGAKSKPISGKFRELFHPGAFAKTIGEQDVHSHNEHEGPYLARSGAGSLRLTDSRSELAYEIDLPDTTAGRDAAKLLERGDIKGCSIGFHAIPAREHWSVDEDGMSLRSVGEARLHRVDLTIAPYYDDSTAELALRSLAKDRGMDVRSVLAAAERGELPALIGDRVTREHIGWLHASAGSPRPPARAVERRDRPHIAWLYT